MKMCFCGSPYHLVFKSTIDTAPILTNEAGKTASSQKVGRVQA